MKIWQRHLFNQLVRTFFFLFFCMFAIYVIVDLSVHGVRFFSDGKSTLFAVAIHYLHTLSILLELFLTLAFLLSTMRVLFDLNIHRELVALQMAGLSKKQLLSPFFLFALFLSIIGYLNTQWLVPQAQDTAEDFRVAHKNKKKKEERIHLYSLSLEDDSELVYQSFDPSKRELFDVFWVRTPDDIWHIKSLQIDSLSGKFANHLTRNSENTLEKSESFETRNFSELPWNQEAILHKFVPFESRPLSTLLFQACVDSSERQSIFSHLHYKIAGPLIPFLVLFAIGPLTLRFSRHQPLFLIASFSLFGFIALKVILDGMLILGENQVLPSSIVIWGPIAAVLLFCIPNFVRMR